ncbi:MAG: hypothetical protein J5I35_07650 [Methanothrix harundinacea]|nr:hypothetical protein [Methanothrix harundinacea]
MSIARRAASGLNSFVHVEEVEEEGWNWYEENAERVIFSARILFWTIRVRVKDILFIVEELFGKRGQRGDS